jgi:alpha-mannosidase
LDKIRIAVDIIDSLAVKLQDLNMDEDGNTISKEILDEINLEYQGFITQKETMTTLLKDFTKKMNTQIEDIRLPCLDKYLSQKYAYVKANSFNCDICSAFSASTKQSLAAHKRSCSKKSKPENIVVETVRK